MGRKRSGEAVPMLRAVEDDRAIRNWSESEVNFLTSHLGVLSMREIGEEIGRTERAVKLYCYRHRLSVRQTVQNPLIPLLLKTKFGNAEYFTPTRGFFLECGIGQKRWSLLVHGYAQPTDTELRAVARALHFSVDEALSLLDARQLELF